MAQLLEEMGCNEKRDCDPTDPAVFQNTVAMKPPAGGVEKPWHQDNSFFRVPLQGNIVAFWLALADVTVDMGAMYLMPHPVRDRSCLGHYAWAGREKHICDAKAQKRLRELGGSIPVGLKKGGLVFFHKLLPHATPTNVSPFPRFAIQFWFWPRSSKKAAEPDSCWAPAIKHCPNMETPEASSCDQKAWDAFGVICPTMQHDTREAMAPE